MYRVLLISLLVSVFGSHGISVLDTSYGSRKFSNLPLKGDNKSGINISDGEPVVKQESFAEVTTVSGQEDQNPIESTETIASNKYEQPSNSNGNTAYEEEVEEEDEEEPEGPPDHVIPYSEHEEAKNVSTKPKYTAPGEWAKPAKGKEDNVEFVPSRVYAQVRKTHTLRRLPRRRAIENAESEEEKENAARLREVVKNSKVNTVYTEEGYEDSAYDHGGRIRDADFHEGYARRLHDQLDDKENSKGDENGDYDEGENETKQKNYKEVRTEDLNEFDDDYSDRYETSPAHGSISNTVRGDKQWNAKVNPKVVTEEGVQTLQEDLEREAAEIDKGVELSKLEKSETTTDRETLAESQRPADYNKRNDLRWRKERQRERLSSSSRKNNDYDDDERDRLKNAGALQNLNNSIADSVDREIESTTLRGILVHDSSGSYKYDVDGNSSPIVDPIDFQRAEENPSTVSYSQLFWDYFKRQPNQLYATDVPAILESTTFNPTHVQGLTVAENVNLVPYSIYGREATTAFPMIEPAILNPQQIIPIGQALLNSEYSKNNIQGGQIIPLEIPNANQLWRPINSHDSPTTESVQFSEIYLNPQKNLDSNEESGKNFASSLFDPTLSSFNRKPRYKMTIRHKPNKPKEPTESLGQESITSNPIIQPLIESTTESVPTNGNYMKVLLHLLNEKNSKNHYRSNGVQQNNFIPSNNKNELEDLTRLRPPLPQKPSDYYYNFSPRDQPDIDATQSAWSSLPVHQRLQQAHTNSRKPPIHLDSSRAKQTLQIQPRRPFVNRKRNIFPPFELIPPSTMLRNDLIRHKETTDYVNRGGNRSKQGRNVLRPFRQTIGLDGLHGIRVKRRERRFAAGQVHDDERNGAAKGTVANNATSNQGEIEQPAKNPSMERNCSQKVTRGVEVGLGLDTSLAKQPGEKKSRSCANDRGEGSHVTERESSVDGSNMDEGRNGTVHVDLRAFKYNEEEKGKGNVSEPTRTKRSVWGMKSKTGGKLEERLENDVSKVGEGNVFESERTKRNVEGIDPRMNDKLGLHDKLLDEAPRIAEDVIQAEINARFNENKERGEVVDDREKKVDVEVPEFDYVEEIMEEEQVDENVPTTEESLNFEKYPFYSNENLPMPSALKYATDPGRLPRKTYGGMEFYNSRDAYKHCDEVEPDLEVSPEKEEPVAERGPEENQPRLRGLGDKLNCFKAKYFDNDPFDNPLFLEKEVNDPEAPQQLDTKQFASRIMMFPNGDDDYVIQRSSKRPENYRQPRKPISVRFQKTGRIRYKNYPRARTRARPRKRPSVYRVQIPQVKNSQNSRKPQKVKNLATSSSEVSSLYMPYQNQVYEDVMGTIKNLASSYQAHEIVTTSSPEETTVYMEMDDDAKTNSSTNSTSNGKKEKNKVQIDIMDQPSDLDINIKGMIRPKNRSRHRPVYKRTRRPQRNKPRIHMMQTPVGAVRTVKHRPRIRVYKRDLRGSDESREEKWSSDELGSTEDSREETEDSGDSEEDHSQLTDAENIRNSRIKPVIENDKKFVAKKNATIPSTIPRPAKRKVLKSVRRISALNGDKNQKKEKNAKLVYTIRDRIRYSKPKLDIKKIGRFVNETEIEEDRRRGEPKYDYIKRKNSTNTVSATAESSAPSTTVITNLTEIVTTTEKIVEEGNPEFKEVAESTQYLVDETRNESANASAKLDDFKRVIEKPKEETANETAGGYAVYENVNEGEPTTTQKPLSATPSEFFNLKTFLEIDPPGYMELSTDDFKRSFFSNDNSTDNLDANSDSRNSNTTDKENNQSVLRSFRPSYFSKDESSEKAETKTKVESSTESSEEISAPSRENDSEEDRTFFTYTPRPYSAAENYEDDKYSDLGPRVNKPAFYHPPFSVSKYRKSRSRGSSEEIAESDEQKETYVFPWQKDKEDQRKRRRNRHRGKSPGEYEYPWERRERLAREENRRKEEQRKRLGNNFDDEDEEEAAETFAVKQQKTIYPRGRHRFWSRRDRDAADNNGSDNTEGSSENQPAMKYSSRYNSKSSKLPLSDKSASGKSRSVEEISRSIKKALEGDSEEKEKSREKVDDYSWENKPSFSYRPRSISRGIIPEDVTLAPSRKPGKRGKLETNDSGDVSSVNKSSSGLKNSLDNSESQINVVKTASREIRNSTNESNSVRQSSKKRRRPLKNAASAVESATVADTETSRSRGRQKIVSTTPATIIGATSASRAIRRRNHKSLNDTKKDTVSKVPNKYNNNAMSGTEMSKSGTVERRSRSRKKNRTNEIINEPTKNDEQRVLSTNDSRETEHLKKASDEQERNPGKEAIGRKSIKDYLNKNEEENDSKGAYPSVKSEEKYDYKDDRMVALSDSDKPDRTYDDDDDDFGSIADTDGNFTPQNGALELSEQGSKELVTAVSWTSENYDF